MDKVKYNELSPEEKKVIIYKGTELPFSGKYDKFYSIFELLIALFNASLFSKVVKLQFIISIPMFCAYAIASIASERALIEVLRNFFGILFLSVITLLSIMICISFQH